MHCFVLTFRAMLVVIILCYVRARVGKHCCVVLHRRPVLGVDVAHCWYGLSLYAQDALLLALKVLSKTMDTTTPSPDKRMFWTAITGTHLCCSRLIGVSPFASASS